jgi:hypothetical protein
MHKKFLDAVNQKKNHWIYYLLGFLCIITSTWIGIFVSTLFKNFITQKNFVLQKQTATDHLINSWIDVWFSPWIVDYIISTIPFLFLLLGVFVATEWIQQRQFITLINPTGSIQWRRLTLGFSVWFFILSIHLLGELLWVPQHF